VALALAASSGACSAVPPASAPSALTAENLQARQLLCGDVGEATCLDACPESLDSRAHADCLLRLRFASDPEALDLARSLYSATNALVGIDVSGTIDGYRGENVELFPALPIGEHRHHLEWIRTSLVSFEAFVESLAAHAPRPVSFQPRPRGFVFFQTATVSYPSAYCSDGLIGYNVRGPLHANQRDMHETLFHELFHLNDAMRSGGWSARALGPLFSSILDRCSDDHACFAPFAPHGTIVPGGTFYAFDRRTRDVREYAAELALRYFLEHEEILAGGSVRRPAFKCLTDENQAAWSALVDEFFGGVDLTASCDR
jgi:hypothetical protein